MTTKNKHKPGWYIYDKGESRQERTIYIHRPFDTREEAELVRRDLLKPYPRGSFWRQRIFVDRKDQ